MKNNTNEIYHSDHLGSSSYITDNFGRPSHYYEYLPFGELMTEHNQSKYYIDPYPTQNMDSYNNPYKFNDFGGKSERALPERTARSAEMDRETGMYYYGARYYDPRISIFISVDPLAEKYPNIGGYVYVANNPINAIDPDGREIIIISGNERYIYDPTKRYEGNNSFIKKNVDVLNAVSTVNIGKKVINEAVKTNKIMTIQEGVTNFGDSHDFDLNSMTLTTRESNYFGVNSDIGTIGHEVFHFYQSLDGQADQSISTEFEAYLFDYMLQLEYGGGSFEINFNDAGDKLQNIVDDLTFGSLNKERFYNKFREGVYSFKEGHSSGKRYSKFPLNEEKKPTRLFELINTNKDE